MSLAIFQRALSQIKCFHFAWIGGGAGPLDKVNPAPASDNVSLECPHTPPLGAIQACEIYHRHSQGGTKQNWERELS